MTWSKARSGFLIAAAFLALSTIRIFSLHADLAVRCTTDASGKTVCRIDEPVVTQRSTDYRQVVFHAGDRVTVNAGGCVQTGGIGPTWKRYVNPSGPNSNRLYWGTISIPGATQGVVRISDVVGRELTVSPGVPDSDSFLRLGYIDDNYDGDGYSDHDDGTENQCKGVGNAFVEITILSTTVGTCGGTTGNSPLDLVWTDCDLNGFPKNPKWRYQVAHNGLVPPAPSELCPSGFGPSCTSWPVTEDSGALCGPHVNWFAATYETPVDWEEKSTFGTDDDYNYRAFPLHDEGVLTHQDLTINGMEVEFDSDETIDHFTSPLWSQFHQLVKNDNSAARQAIKGNRAVITGLFGLDGGHPDYSSELHPAYAVAVDMDDSNLSDDKWGVFARNWGDEGYCADNQHFLPVRELKLLIPWLPGATSVMVNPDTQFYVFADSDSNAAVPSPQISVATGQGILIDFVLPAPAEKLGVEGEVHLQWTGSEAARLRVRAAAQPARRAAELAIPAVRAGARPEVDKPEQRAAKLISQMTAPQLQVFRSRLQATAAPPVGRQGVRLPLRPAVSIASLPHPPRLAQPIAPASSPDPRSRQRSESLRVSLCEAYNNAVPGYPSICLSRDRIRDHRIPPHP